MKYLYRLSSGEIVSISSDPTVWTTGVDTRFLGVLDSPTEDPALDRSKPMIWDGTKVRNATATEIAGFPTAEQNDETLRTREETAELFLADKSQFGKMFRLITLVAMDEINTLRAQHGLPALTLTDVRTKARALLDAGAVD